MPSDKPGSSRSYLHSVLVDGAKPFLYRSNVRALLGLPEREDGQLAFSPTLPPVGFKYTDEGSGFSLHLGGVATTLEDFPGREGAFYPARDHVADLPEEERRAVNALGGRARAELDALLSTTGEDVQLDAATAQTPFATQRGVESAPASSERTNAEVSGVSEKQLPFPALRPAEQGDDGCAQESGQKVAPQSPLGEAGRDAQPHTATAQTPFATWHEAESAPASSGQTDVQIPGVSEKRLPFPTLRPAEQGDDGRAQKSGPRAAPQSPLDGASGDGQPDAAVKQVGASEELEARPRLEMSSASSRRGWAKTPHPERAPGESDPGPPKAMGHASLAIGESLPESEGADQRHSQVCSKTRESISTTHAQLPSTHASEKLSKPGVAQVSLAAPPAPNRLENSAPAEVGHASSVTSNRPPRFTVWNEPEPDRTPVPIIRDGNDTASRPSADAATRVDQLRHAVHQLTAKVSSQPARANDEIQARQPERPPPPPVQPIVVVKRPPVQRRAPRAFWERSYLSHLHLRTLR